MSMHMQVDQVEVNRKLKESFHDSIFLAVRFGRIQGRDDKEIRDTIKAEFQEIVTGRKNWSESNHRVDLACGQFEILFKIYGLLYGLDRSDQWVQERCWVFAEKALDEALSVE